MGYSTKRSGLRPLQKGPRQTEDIKDKKGPGRIGNRLHEKRVGRKNYQLSARNLPSGSLTHGHCSSWLPGSALPKNQGREAVAEWPRETGRKRGRKASLLGGVARSRRASPRPARGLFSFISDASTPQAATSQLTQLAMEHSPNTLPISATSQEQRMPTRWRHHLLSPFPAYLLTTTHFRRRAHPAPPPASLPSRPGPAGAGHRAGFRTRRPGFLASVVPR